MSPAPSVRRSFVVPTLLLLLAVPSAAQAATEIRVEHRAPVPCAVTCANWEPARSAGYDVCDRPFPPGSFDRSTFRITEGQRLVSVTSHFAADYDLFLCTDTEPSVLFPVGCLSGQKCMDWNCQPTVILYIGCRESLELSLESLHRVNGGANDRFRVVSMNWLDPGSAHVSVRGPVELVDDSFEVLS